MKARCGGPLLIAQSNYIETMDIILRKEALKNGLPRYFTGKPCKRGHRDERKTSNGTCFSCASLSSKAWNDKNPYYYLGYVKENKEKISEYHKSRYVEKGNHINCVQKKYRIENSEKIRVKTMNRRLKIAGAEGTHTAKDVALMLVDQKYKCVYCNDDLNIAYHVDHIMPLALGGSNWPGNLQCLCPTCNTRKGAKHPDVWHKEIGYALP